ncbi:MAG: NTP transferase domain-containing protein [Nanoarchaeota archaeon]
MKAIILAAGANSRLGNLIDIPKCLLPLKESTILENQINALTKAGLRKEDILIVVGYKAEMIQKLHEHTLFNQKFLEFDNGYSVYLALKHLTYRGNLGNDEQIFILDGDLVYDEDLIKKITASNKENILVNRPVMYSTELKDEISITDSNGKILELIIPSKQNPLHQKYSAIPLYSFTGIMKISKKVAVQLYEKLKTSYQKWYTLPLPELVPVNNFYSFAVPKTLKYCFDVDTKEDLERLSKIR